MNSRRFNSRKFRKGSLLSLVMVIALCLALLGLGMLQLGYWSRSTAAASTFVINARMAADAGLQAALYQMNLDFPASPTLGSQSGNLDNSTASYTYDISNTVSGNFQIDSTGTCAGKTRTVHAVTGYSSIFDYALFVTNNITLRSGAVIDGYDSRFDSYENTNPKLPVEIGSNTKEPRQGSGGEEGIFLISDVDLNGNVAVGVGLSPEEIWGEGSNKGVISGDPDSLTGTAYSLQEPYIWANVPELLQIAVSDVGGYQAQNIQINNFSVGEVKTIGNPVDISGKVTITPYNVVECSDFDILNSGVLEVYGNVILHVTSDLRLGNSAQIFVTEGSSLRIFLDGTFTSDNSCLLTNANTLANPQPKWFSIYGVNPVEQNWNVQYGGNFYGIIYAPNANVIVKNSGDIYGSIASKSFRLDNSGNVHYDMALAEEEEFFTGYIIQRWWEE